jgi:hypothetical protein
MKMNPDVKANSATPAQEPVKSMPSGLEKVRALGAVVSILGASLGVNVGDALAAPDPAEKATAEQLKIKAAQQKSTPTS